VLIDNILEKLSVLSRDYAGRPQPGKTALHLQAAMEWIYRAQDATPDRGVSHSYAIGGGWLRSYPETTGYIIPTLLNIHVLTGEAEARQRALEMADWELSARQESGAIPSLVDHQPVVFDTGQVIFGWLRAYEVTKDTRYLEAATKAADWLIASLDPDGIWRKHGNPGTNGEHVYNVRTAWALIALSQTIGDSRYSDAMRPFLRWVLAQETERGWFRQNCLTQNQRPLLHTIAYTAQGLLESGAILGDDEYIAASQRTAEELAKHVGPDGRMPGRFDDRWQPAVGWACLTGMAQASIVWQRLDRFGHQSRYSEVVRKVHSFLKRTQDLKTKNPGIRGGIRGSFPVNGEYLRYKIPNWAAKFFIDALLLEQYPNHEFPLY
jgi:uncharacterized protein YyaL (SSP411 family)